MVLNLDCQLAFFRIERGPFRYGLGLEYAHAPRDADRSVALDDEAGVFRGLHALPLGSAFFANSFRGFAPLELFDSRYNEFAPLQGTVFSHSGCNVRQPFNPPKPLIEAAAPVASYLRGIFKTWRGVDDEQFGRSRVRSRGHQKAF